MRNLESTRGTYWIISSQTWELNLGSPNEGNRECFTYRNTIRWISSCPLISRCIYGEQLWPTGLYCDCEVQPSRERRQHQNQKRGREKSHWKCVSLFVCTDPYVELLECQRWRIVSWLGSDLIQHQKDSRTIKITNVFTSANYNIKKGRVAQLAIHKAPTKSRAHFIDLDFFDLVSPNRCTLSVLLISCRWRISCHFSISDVSLIRDVLYSLCLSTECSLIFINFIERHRNTTRSWWMELLYCTSNVFTNGGAKYLGGLVQTLHSKPRISYFTYLTPSHFSQ